VSAGREAAHIASRQMHAAEPYAAGLTAIVAPLAAELAGVLAAASGLRRQIVPRPRRRPASWPGSPGATNAAQVLPAAPELPRQRAIRRLFFGRLGGAEVVIAATGDGAPAAAAGVAALLAAVRPRRLLAIGVAGGLTPGLTAGSLVAARQVCDENGVPAARQPDARWLAEAVACGATAGVAVAARQILGDAQAKQAARRAALAGAAVTVDLESMAYAAAAAAHGLPYLVVRAVLDPAEEELPLDFERCRGALGRVSQTRVVLRALRRPGSFVELWRLRGRVRAVAAQLGGFAERLMQAAGEALPVEPGAAEAKAAVFHSKVNETAAAGGRRA
jgi:adenosylhomocysteine nucleosidase